MNPRSAGAYDTFPSLSGGIGAGGFGLRQFENSLDRIVNGRKAQDRLDSEGSSTPYNNRFQFFNSKRSSTVVESPPSDIASREDSLVKAWRTVSEIDALLGSDFRPSSSTAGLLPTCAEAMEEDEQRQLGGDDNYDKVKERLSSELEAALHVSLTFKERLSRRETSVGARSSSSSSRRGPPCCSSSAAAAVRPAVHAALDPVPAVFHYSTSHLEAAAAAAAAPSSEVLSGCLSSGLVSFSLSLDPEGELAGEAAAGGEMTGAAGEAAAAAGEELPAGAAVAAGGTGGRALAGGVGAGAAPAAPAAASAHDEHAGAVASGSCCCCPRDEEGGIGGGEGTAAATSGSGRYSTSGGG
ncbi:hypothetical protein Agub_g10658, partial [Astrephomene gubernaculifera]